MTTNTNSRIALITEGTKGIGLEVARQVAQKGMEVLIASRDERLGGKIIGQLTAANLPVTYIHIDITNQATIDLAVTEVANAYGRLDILVNNSGVYLKEPRPSEVTLEIIRENLEVNFFGVFAVTKAFLSLLRQSSSGHIVNVSSALGSFDFHEQNKESYLQCAYSTSKTSLNMLTILLARDLRGTKIKVNACAPSITTTQLTHHDHVVETTVKSIVFLTTLFDDDGQTGKIFGQDGEEIKW